MPEGPEIRRAADEVAAAIEGRIANAVRFGLDELKPRESEFAGRRIIAVETRGKAMLTRFEHGLNIYSHNQLYGRWYTSLPNRPPEIGRQLRLAIETEHRWALLYSASDIAVLSDDETASHPFLASLGPDVLDPATTAETVLGRLLDRRYRNRRLGNFLTDQKFVAGLGNYLRCEILFATALSPQCKPSELDATTLEHLAANIIELPRQSYRTRGITNDLDRAEKLLATGASFEEARFQVFRRAGKPCYRCGGIIEKVTKGGQACYLCRRCQQ